LESNKPYNFEKVFEKSAPFYVAKMEFNTSFAFDAAVEANAVYIRSFGVSRLSENVDKNVNNKLKSFEFAASPGSRFEIEVKANDPPAR